MGADLGMPFFVTEAIVSVVPGFCSSSDESEES